MVVQSVCGMHNAKQLHVSSRGELQTEPIADIRKGREWYLSKYPLDRENVICQFTGLYEKWACRLLCVIGNEGGRLDGANATAIGR